MLGFEHLHSRCVLTFTSDLGVPRQKPSTFLYPLDSTDPWCSPTALRGYVQFPGFFLPSSGLDYTTANEHLN